MLAKHKVAEGIARLEAISAEFSYDKSREYVSLAKSFLRIAQSISYYSPFFDVCGNIDLVLPPDINHRLDRLLLRKPDYRPTVRNVCKWYLRELYEMELGKRQETFSFYEPLIQLLESGGDFYEHHGDLCIRDAATILYRNTKI